MPAKRSLLRFVSGPLGLIFIAFSTIALVLLVLGESQHFYVMLYGIAWLVCAPVYWLINSPDRGVLLAGSAVVAVLLMLLSWLRRRRGNEPGP